MLCKYVTEKLFGCLFFKSFSISAKGNLRPNALIFDFLKGKLTVMKRQWCFVRLCSFYLRGRFGTHLWE